ncbi:restriction endonuclease subunit S [Thiopseudomonas acetoxidans]|uniref:Restriction endonuclease subunit S n=1 Tax=Thiopseudomonas acetoxidans TaxID=3041622 RepID=A0ABT7SQ23_9GAMM|nr:restriction endonuclease subunit S [Thiopseudomonas sp. CY1220]MDM7858276.1 restriction endonuclease subunit S [Thiopseudomonas sp. CY1220]
MIKPSSLGKLPSEWTNKKFGEITKVRQGLQIPISERLLVPTATSKEYITIQSINRHNQEREYVESPSSRVTCTTDDVLMTRTGNTGIVVTGVEGVFHNNFFLIDFDKSKINTVFLVNYLTSPRVQHVIQVNAGASTIPDLNHKDFYSIEFPLAPILEQNEIAQILSTWDKAITTTEQLLANSQQQKKALMQQLLTGKKRLLDDNGVRFSGEWEDIRLKDVLREEKSRNKDNAIERVLSVTNHSGFVLPEEQFSKRVASVNVSNYKVVRKGQYGYNPSRLNVGSFARLDSYDEGLLSPMYVVFSLNKQLLNSDYFLNWMSSNEAKQRIAGSTQGSVRDSVGFDALCGFPFKLPPMEEQQKIAAVLSSADQEIDSLQQKIEALKQEKKALMQQLLTGKRRVKLN